MGKKKAASTTGNPPEVVTTDCGGTTPRVLTLCYDADHNVVKKTTHPQKFSKVKGTGEFYSYRCSQCGGCISVPEPEDISSWKEVVEVAGSSLHTPACAKRRKRKRVPDAKQANFEQAMKRAKPRAGPPLPKDSGALRSAFAFPPFSLIRMDLGPFQKRTKQWLEITGMDDASGRDAELINYGPLSDRGGTSRFNPTLAEGCYRFWCPDPERAGRTVIVLDVCAGGPTRGVVAAKLGLLYIGIDCSSRQVAANIAQLAACEGAAHLPIWLHGDGEDCVSLFRKALKSRGLPEDTPADMVFTCPPYWNLEQYDPKNKLDLSSAPTYDKFVKKFSKMLANAASLLRDGHCFVIAIGNLRDTSSGELLDLHGDTKRALADAGCRLYNDAVLVTPIVAAGKVAGSTAKGCKLVPTHQNLVVACKGEVLSVERAKQFHFSPVDSGEAAAGEATAESEQSEELEASTTFTVPLAAVRRFASLSTEERTQLFARVIKMTDEALRPAVKHQRLVLQRAKIKIPSSYGRCMDVSRAWALLDPSVELRREWRGAHRAIRACAQGGCSQCTEQLFHVFLEVDGERVDATAEQLKLYGAVTTEAESCSVEPTGQARSLRVRVGDAEQRIASSDLVTLKAAVRELVTLEEAAAGCVADPAAITPIEKVGNAWAKRDDLFSVNGARGSKARTMLAIAQDAKREAVGVVVAASRDSTMLGRVARVCAHVGVPCRLHVSHSKTLSTEEEDAHAHGATLVKHNISFLDRIAPRADADATERGWRYIPFGIECEEHLESVRKQVRDIPAGVKRIVITVGSAMVLAGVLQGLTDCGRSDLRILGVQVSDRSPEPLLDRQAPGWRERVTLLPPITKYSKPAQTTTWRGIPLDPFYEAKACRHLKSGDLFWIVAVRSSAVV